MMPGKFYLIKTVFLGLMVAVAYLMACNINNDKKNSLTITPAFYHWKTTFNPTGFEKNVLQQNKVEHLYLRFFDVSWDDTYQQPTPIAQLRFGDTSLKENRLQIIPTVFITNECIRNIKPEQCKLLAHNIVKLISSISASNGIDSIKEVQMDCDWTASTKEKYFSLLTELQKIDTVHLYSATIRLFQIKYAAEAGVPPVKKGLLMCYNMGNLKSMATQNSILDVGEVKKYISALNKYSLPLDIALPLFQWYVLFRQGAYAGLVQNISAKEFQSFSKPISSNRIEIIADTVFKNTTFKKGDMLRLEECSFNNIMKTADVLKQKLKNENRRLVLYHLDSITLNKYSTHEIKSVFSSLH